MNKEIMSNEAYKTNNKNKLAEWLGISDEELKSYFPKKETTKNIYIFKHNQACKIGIANNIKRRQKVLENSSGMEISLVYSKKIKFAQATEQHLHSMFQAQKIKGEWFALSDEDIASAISFIETR